MKSMFKFLSLLLIATTVVFASCSKDDDPADNNLFVGTYRGSVTYTGDKTVSNPNGSVTVVKTGDRYDFKFSDGIPSITNVNIPKGTNSQVSITPDGYTGSISIDAKNLKIGLIKEGNNWGADCKR
ncbi:hypothetical protein [Niabella drilacis]|uniref:Uncharacterized protein n=1 Tax=Niabella drilacis (strain DSM 25811 / CCM 8410 / CCUG 62505 / LMG 26954 / E90) TaxID=1285928 RepID=A0A1G6IBN7_NIADE|nr:hypothetical protein [Niabella drilacis]SDC03425.1 hypothetical protein SAMN04487894_101152 [Niabella drilacis]